MNSAPEMLRGSFVRELLATAWPPSERGDSQVQQRLKAAVRGGQLAMVLLVVAAVGATFAPHAEQASAARIVGLCFAGVAYIVWSIYGLRNTVRVPLYPDANRAELSLRGGLGIHEQWASNDSCPPGHSARKGPLLPANSFRDFPGCGSPPGVVSRALSTLLSWEPRSPARLVVYFGVQFGLAQLMYVLGDRGRVTAVMWLVLLPPVAHSVMLLPRWGVALVCGTAIGLFIANMTRWYGWNLVQNAALAFSFSVLFTVVFTFLAVAAEQSREQVQRLASELTEANRKLRAYAVQVEDLSVARERNRLAREIHDSLGHYLTVVNVQIEAARSLQEVDLPRAREALQKAQAFAQQGLQEVRISVAALRSSPLDNKTLSQAVTQLTEESSASGLAASLEVLGEERTLSSQSQLTLYRAAQEGLTNARKHSQATMVQLQLDFRAGGSVRFRISDNGVGAQAVTPGFGLLGLQERVALLHGRVQMKSEPGFTLEMELPG